MLFPAQRLSGTGVVAQGVSEFEGWLLVISDFLEMTQPSHESFSKLDALSTLNPTQNPNPKSLNP